MADGHDKSSAPDPRAVARDWITIWQSELSALATDREMQEAWVRLVALWAQAAERVANLLPAGASGDPPGRAVPFAAPRATAPMAASDARDATIQQLAERVAELERRLAAPPAKDRGNGRTGT